MCCKARSETFFNRPERPLFRLSIFRGQLLEAVIKIQVSLCNNPESSSVHNVELMVDCSRLYRPFTQSHVDLVLGLQRNGL